MANIGVWLTLLVASCSAAVQSANAANPCVAKAIPKIQNATYLDEVKARFTDPLVYNQINSRSPVSSTLFQAYKLYYEPRMLVCVLDQHSTQSDLDALEKIPAFGGEVFVLMSSALSAVNPPSDELGNDNSEAKYVINDYALEHAQDLYPIPRGADGCTGGCAAGRQRAEALAKQQMLPTLGPAHRQLIHVYNYDDTTGKPNPTGVLAFINEVIFAVETMHQDLAFRTFDRSVGAQHLTMDLPYYQPPYAADAYPHPLFVASTLEPFFAQMSIISHSREENLADNFLAAFSANRASFKNALRPDFGIHTVTSPDPQFDSFSTALWQAQCTSFDRGDLDRLWPSYGGTSNVVYLRDVSARYCHVYGGLRSFDFFDQLRVDSNSVDAVEDLSNVMIGGRTDTAIGKLTEIMTVNTRALVDIDNFTGQSFFDAKIQDIKGKIDVLNTKANDNVMNHLGQIVQLATAVYSLYNGVGEVQAIYTGVSAAFHNAPDDQSYADTLNNYVQENKANIKTAAADVENAYAGIEAGIAIVASLNVDGALAKADELEEQLKKVRAAYSEFLLGVQQDRSYIKNSAKDVLDQLSILDQEAKVFPVEVLDNTIDDYIRAAFGTAITGTSPEVLLACITARRNFGREGTTAKAANIVGKCEPFETAIKSYFECAQSRPASDRLTVITIGDRVSFIANKRNFADTSCVR